MCLHHRQAEHKRRVARIAARRIIRAEREQLVTRWIAEQLAAQATQPTIEAVSADVIEQQEVLV
jgi:hypothetical protein